MIKAYNETTNRKIRVFISSTFTDMAEERNVIVNNVFPRLREYCSERMVDIVEVDLRWGISQNDVENGKVINICLGEVLKCRPFFIGILGERYGYVPELSDVDKVDEEIKKEIGSYPPGISITEMEIRMGALNAPSGASASFYFRTDSKISEIEKEKIDKLTLLKDVIKQKYGNKYYDSLYMLEEYIYNDLIAYIDGKFPTIPEVPYKDKSYFSHLNLLKHHSESHLANNELIDRIIDSNDNVVLYGLNGTGKTATLAYATKQLSNNSEVFFHFVSADSNSYKMSDIYRRLRLYLNEIVSSEIRNDVDEIFVKEQLSHLEKNLVIIIDNINLLQGSPNPATEFSHLLRKNVRIIITSNEESNLSAFSDIKMPGLTKKQIIRIVDQFFVQFSKSFPLNKARMLANNKGCKNPLFLKIVINEIRKFGSFENFDDFFDKICVIDEFDLLYTFIVEKFKEYCMERKIPGKYVELIPLLLVCSNKGLSEKEIMDITQLPPIMWASFYSFLQTYILEFNGKIQIINYDFAKTIIGKINSEQEIKQTRLILYKHFILLDSERKIEEGIYQEHKLGYFDKLIKNISNPNTFNYLYETDYNLVLRYFSSFMSKGNTVLRNFKIDEFSDSVKLVRFCEILTLSGCFDAGLKIIEKSLKNIQSSDERITLKSFCARILYKLGQSNYRMSNKAYEDLISEYSHIYPNDEVGLAEHKFKYAISVNSSGQPQKAREIYQEVVSTFKKHDIRNHLSSWALGNLANSYYTMGCFNKADGLFREAIEIRRELFGNDSKEVAWEYCYCFSNLFALEKYDEAFRIAEKAKDISIGLEYAWSVLNYAVALAHKRMYENAIKYLDESIQINDSVVDQKLRPHVYSLTAYNNKAAIYFLMQQTKPALDKIKETIKLKEEKSGESHVYTANSYLNYANMLGANQSEEAKKFIDKAIAVFENDGDTGLDLAFAFVCKLVIAIKEKNSAESVKIMQKTRSLLSEKSRDTGLVHHLYAKIDKSFMISKNLPMTAYASNGFYLTANNESEFIILPKTLL
ncbi:tetratricopeptide repeat protein [Candidatus Bathycorpusculum sp.]|uniref:tetratricopeptide repeat protein n=1 Tax=Candidatus Bathycorpusculum sp. TaxID=2994959 RepID=UPI0028175254|nr:tetratricopeptide repeat protein [Candidatus Termitimicrobium sp.]